ncbi:MAG: response regulator [Desulfobacteraceae bacterium]|jgi:DNA-binding NtrC family response regulator
MSGTDALQGKRVLAVDDEPDVLDALEEILEMCVVVKAVDFETAKNLMDSQSFDFAILDIMGVDGYRLLEAAQDKGIVAVMLTAHALSVRDTVKSYQKGAASYVPKEKITELSQMLEDILEARERGKHFWWRWLDRMGAYYDKRFGPDWQEQDREFWEKHYGL